MAIQAFDTSQIERFGASNLNEIADLATQVAIYPGSSGNGANMVIRGYGSGYAWSASNWSSSL